MSQLQQVDLLQDLLQDDRPNFDIHLLQQSVLLGFFWNFWELWFVCFANSLTCGAKKMRRNHFFWGGVCPIPKLPEAIEFSRMPPDFFDSRNLLRFFFGCETWVVIRSHQYINISASVSKSQLRWEMSPFSESKLTL